MKKYAFILFFFLIQVHLFAEPVKMDEKTWSELAEELDYSEQQNIEDKEVEEEPEREEEYTEGSYQEPPNLLPKFHGFGAVKALIFLGVIVLLVLLIAYLSDKDLFKSFGSKKVIRVNIDDPDYLDQSDLERSLQLEFDQSNFRACIRIYYLLLLESLDSKRKIHWKKAKTNRQYIIEVKEKPIRKNLKNLTKVYEEVWFGNHVLDLKNYKHWSQEFKTVIKEPTA